MGNRLRGMADDYDRLIQAARALRQLVTPAEIARYIGTYDQMMTNWKARGIPKREVLDIADKIGCNPYWLRDGKGSMADYNNDRKIQSVIKAMEVMPEYKKDVLVQTSNALVEQPKSNLNNTQ